MKKAEAIEAMKRGEKITHRYFQPNEYVYFKGGLIIHEDGASLTPEEFWNFREDDAWEIDWEIFVPQTKTIETKDIKWNDGFLLGSMLLTRQIQADSLGNPIAGMSLYRIGIHTPTGNYIVVPKGTVILDTFSYN